MCMNEQAELGDPSLIRNKSKSREGKYYSVKRRASKYPFHRTPLPLSRVISSDHRISSLFPIQSLKLVLPMLDAGKIVVL